VRKLNPVVNFFSPLGTLVDEIYRYPKSDEARPLETHYKSRFLDQSCQLPDEFKYKFFNMRGMCHAMARMLLHFFNVNIWCKKPYKKPNSVNLNRLRLAYGMNWIYVKKFTDSNPVIVTNIDSVNLERIEGLRKRK